MSQPPPSKGPAAWRSLGAAFSETTRLVKRHQLSLVASSLAFDTLLSIIPLLAVSFAVFHAFGGLERLQHTLEPFILSNLAQGSGAGAAAALRGFIANANASAVGAGGFIGLVVTSMILLSSADAAINRVWDVPLKRPLFAQVASYWLLITMGPLALAVLLGLATSRDLPAARFLPSGLGVAMVVPALLFCVYQFVPARKVDWRCALCSASLTGLLLSLAGLGYEIYAKKAVSYSKIYGPLSAIPLLMVWVYLLWLITLAGAAFTAGLQKHLPDGK